MKLTLCACGTHRPAAGCCPNCSHCRSRKLGVSAAALLGLIACNGGETDTDGGGDSDTDVAIETGGGEPDYGVAYLDADGDGYDEGEDCDDADPAVHPGAAETPADGTDSNCDGDDDT